MKENTKLIDQRSNQILSVQLSLPNYKAHSSLKQSPHNCTHTQTAHSLWLKQVFVIILLLRKSQLKLQSEFHSLHCLIYQLPEQVCKTCETNHWRPAIFNMEKSLLRVLTSVRAATNWRYFFIKVVWSTTVGPCAETNAILEEERSAFST